MTEAPDAVDVLAVLAAVDRSLPFTELRTTSSAATVWCTDVVAHVRSGGDPLAPWRAGLHDQLAARHAAAVGAHVPAAFVLQWWCEVAATPVAHAALLGPWVLDPHPAGLGFELGPALHPYRLVVDPARAELRVETDEERRLARARTVYDRLVSDVVARFAPDVKMSSRQRWGVVDDVWAMTLRRALGAAGRPTGPDVARTSCCFIVALPGMRECAGCPRSSAPRGRGRRRDAVDPDGTTPARN